MRSDSPQRDPKTIWKNQPTEPYTMTLEKIQDKARELHAKTRRGLLGNLAVLFIVVILSGFGMQQFPAGKLPFALAITWGLIGLYFLNRGMWSSTTPGDAGLITGVDFYRQEIERRRALFRRVLLWSFGPMLLAIGTLVLVLVKIGGAFAKVMPLITLVVVWIVAVFVVRMRQQHNLQREIDELNRVESKNGR